ncbi:MAG TPA: site-specific integrase [Terriglobia bacterium]|nr:site-specific integrase [Terriglobia bacterium]
MAIFKRGNVYWYHFLWNGKHVQKSTKQGNPNVARTIEAARRTALAKGEAGIFERKAAPSLKDFRERFAKAIEVRSAAKPRTIEFYKQQYARLLDFEPLASARLDRIDESLIEVYIQHRSQTVSAPTVNRSLATLRRALRLAQEWRVIDRIPRIRLLPGEHNREFILRHDDEAGYLQAASQPLADISLLILDTGLRVGEVVALEWPDVHTEPAGKAKFGYAHIRDGKSANSRRNVPLTVRARAMLVRRRSQSLSFRVFTGAEGLPLLVSSLDHQHKTLRAALNLSGEFVLHSLRHTYGTRLGEAGVGAFEIMQLMGHSSVTISQRYVHPTPESLERAVERLEALNRSAKQARPATVSATATKAIVRK